MDKKTKIILITSAIILILSIVLFIFSSKTSCDSFSVENCPNRCVVCPPCEVCSSISCQTEEFCKEIGFDRSWYESIRQRLNEPNQ